MRAKRTMVLTGAVIGIITAAGQAQFTFLDVDYSTPSEPKGLAVGDFNGDGAIDVALTAQDQASLMLNAGDGTFSAPSNFALDGLGAAHLIGANLNGDNNLDLAAVLSKSNQVRVMVNNGDGTFAQGALLNVGTLPTWMNGFDADGDGDVDLGVVNTGAGSVTVLFNSGDGGFPGGSTFPVGADPRCLAAADFDGDGDLDLAVTRHTSRTVGVFVNDGTGTYTFAQSIAVGGKVAPESITAADLDKDGDADLAATASVDGGPGLAAVFRNSGGTFALPDHYQLGAGDPGAIIAADFNGDGNSDLASIGRGSDELALLRGIGDGTFNNPQTLGTGDNPRRIRAGDFNGDGSLDVVVNNRDSSSITVFTNDGVQGGCLADMDGNGVLELFDFLEFQNKFNAQDPVADCDMNGTFDLFDFLCFQNLFLLGCQ